MICPLRIIGHTESVSPGTAQCRDTECAWWTGSGCCMNQPQPGPEFLARIREGLAEEVKLAREFEDALALGDTQCAVEILGKQFFGDFAGTPLDASFTVDQD